MSIKAQDPNSKITGTGASHIKSFKNILKDFKFRVNESRELMVMNPPIVKFDEFETENLNKTTL